MYVARRAFTDVWEDMASITAPPAGHGRCPSQGGDATEFTRCETLLTTVKARHPISILSSNDEASMVLQTWLPIVGHLTVFACDLCDSPF